ncbi:hypothetical protein L6V77_24960, partial [Myxococcota bacterium]|nr:hypothetical protein [Myxococcota bacterium]
DGREPPPPPAPPSDGREPPPPPACPEEALTACRDAGAAAGRACADAGGTREECRAASMEAGRACVAEACPAP